MKEKRAIQETFEEYSVHYEESMDGELNRFWGWSYAKFLEELVKRTPIHEGQKILDIATGTAMIPRRISSKNIPDVQITGLDITEAMLVKGKAEMSVVLDSIRIAETDYAIQTNEISFEANSTKGDDAKAVGISTAIGAALGTIFGGGKGAAVGAATGAGAGTAGVLLSRGKDIELEKERLLSFRLEQDLEILEGRRNP